MTGVSEILVLILLISGILILPRMFKPAPVKTKRLKKVSLTKTKRGGIVLSILVPIAAAIGFKPWTGNLVLFVSIGIIPVVLAWAIVWILAAQKK